MKWCKKATSNWDSKNWIISIKDGSKLYKALSFTKHAWQDLSTRRSGKAPTKRVTWFLQWKGQWFLPTSPKANSNQNGRDPSSSTKFSPTAHMLFWTWRVIDVCCPLMANSWNGTTLEGFLHRVRAMPEWPKPIPRYLLVKATPFRVFIPMLKFLKSQKTMLTFNVSLFKKIKPKIQV